MACRHRPPLGRGLRRSARFVRAWRAAGGRTRVARGLHLSSRMNTRTTNSKLALELAITFVIAVVLCSAADAAEPAAVQSVESIAAAARDFATKHGLQSGARRSVEVGALDARLRLASCPQPLHAAAAPGVRSSLRMTVEVRCPSSGGWRLFV